MNAKHSKLVILNIVCVSRDQETEQLTQQIDIITHAIQREKDTAAELELKSRLFSFGKYKAEDQVNMNCSQTDRQTNRQHTQLLAFICIHTYSTQSELYLGKVTIQT